MTNLFQLLSIVGGIALAGLLVCLRNIRKAMVVGMGVAWVATILIFFFSLTELNTLILFRDFLDKSSPSFITVLLVSFYFFCIMKNKEFVVDGLMPDLWYTFSYYIVVFTGLNIVALIRFFEKKESLWNSMAMLGNTLLFAFVVIEWIICTFYRTDGFRV
jgi:hypothetical protein